MSDSQLVQVAAAFAAYGQGTATEVIFAAELDRRENGPRSYHLRKQIAELEDMGLLCGVGRRPCEITGRPAQVLMWNPTGENVTERPIRVELAGTAVEMLDSDPMAIVAAIKAEAARQLAQRAKLRAKRATIVAVVEESRQMNLRGLGDFAGR